MPPPKPSLKRCAIYTRKSSEDGLEQDFNSLHAQRESCEAFIKSQKAEGWLLVETPYDDGGFSGGTMERPALRSLLDDIRAKRIDIVVVYKIDRLTRSLADFAKMVEVFDASGISFVAVTQQFNTTSSMGRLTLNILLSFAQFEREVTAERIRDKISASKQKGMWMGGNVPLGYDVKERKLIINPPEAATVQTIFRRYLDLGCVRRLKTDLERSGIRSKIRTAPDGSISGDKPFSRGSLYAMLANPIYMGKIRHKELCHPGLHQGILDQDLWDAVQAQLSGNGVDRAVRPVLTESSLLLGKLYDQAGERLTPSHSVKKGRRYRYYVSRSLITGTAQVGNRGWRLPAPDLDRAVAQAVRSILADQNALSIALTEVGIGTGSLSACLSRVGTTVKQLETGTTTILADLVQRVEVSEDGLAITLSLAKIVVSDGTTVDSDAPSIIRIIPMRIHRRGVELRLVINSDTAASRADPALVKASARARAWWNDLASGAMPSITAIAKREGVSDGYVGQLLPLAFLAPAIAEAIVTGDHPPGLTVETLVKHTDLPLSWEQQRSLLGFS